MSKSNKELAVEVAIAAINANPKMVLHEGNDGVFCDTIAEAIKTESIIDIITSVYNTLENFDNKNKT